MAITKQDKQELDQLYAEWSRTYKGCKEDYFAVMYLTKKFRLSADDVAAHISFGNNDFGIDAYHIDTQARNLYLYQFKWSENHNLFKESMDRLAKHGMERIFGNPFADPVENELLNNIRADVYECKSLIDRVFVQFVFKGDLDAAENSEGIRDRRENIENKIHLVHEYFNNPAVELVVEFITDKRRLPPPPTAETHKLGFSDNASVRATFGQREMYVGLVPLMDLYRIYRSLGQRFFNRNVRFGLAEDSPPNRKIREALSDIVVKQKTQPEVFCFNHNGVTLAAEAITAQDGHVIVKVPRLLNGAQTVTSLTKFLQDNEGHPSLASNGERLESIRVLARIVIDDPSSEFVTNVTVCNNRQNPVEPWNLRANDRIQCDLHDKFREEVGLFYSRQENSFQGYTVEELDELGFETTRDIRIRPLAQTFLAVQGEITRMSKLADVFENPKWYQETFRESYLHADARKMVMAYKVHLVLRDPIKRMEERSAQWMQTAIVRARNLIWALLIQGIFNDPHLDRHLDDFGRSLKKETPFRTYLSDLAGKRVLPILRDIMSKDEYKQRIDKGYFEFVRTKEVFNLCKDAAYEKFSWVKKSF